MRGTVLQVGDGDGFRMFHQPFLRFFGAPSKNGTSFRGIGITLGCLSLMEHCADKLSETTISVRLAGVDAPEKSYFGVGVSQPFSDEAHAWLRTHLLGRKVTIEPLAIDQYKRVVAMVYTGPFFWRKNVSVELVEQGLGVIYDSAGAEYGEILGELKSAQKRAQRKKLKIWSQKTVETPMEWKAKNRQQGTGTSSPKKGDT